MENIKKIEYNKTYIIEDIFSTGITEIDKLKSLIDIKNSLFMKSNYMKNGKLQIIFSSFLMLIDLKK